MHAHGIALGLTRIALIILCFTSAGSTVSAQADEPNLETTLVPGLTVWITDSAGRDEKTRIVGVSGGVVTTTAGGDIRRLRQTEIMRASVRQSDTVINGAVIGAVAAVASGLFLCRLTEPWEICRDVGPIVRIGAIGAGLGIGIDALIRGRRTIYEAPQRTTRLLAVPLVARHAAGLQLVIRF